MPKRSGFVGTVEVETDSENRIWFGLTSKKTGAAWLKTAGKRMWFTMSLETRDRPAEMGKLTLLMEALRSKLEVQVTFDGAASFRRRVAGDSFEVERLRILRGGLSF